jgi:hypothetical protein
MDRQESISAICRFIIKYSPSSTCELDTPGECSPDIDAPAPPLSLALVSDRMREARSLGFEMSMDLEILNVKHKMSTEHIPFWLKNHGISHPARLIINVERVVIIGCNGGCNS